MRYIAALILLTTAVITGGVGASISRVEEPMIIRTPHQQHSHQLRARSNIQQQQPSLIPLQRNLQNTIEFCGKCTWSGKISCEARAQFLVKEGRFTTLQDARVSILDSCKPDGSDKAKAPLGKLFITYRNEEVLMYVEGVESEYIKSLFETSIMKFNCCYHIC